MAKKARNKEKTKRPASQQGAVGKAGDNGDSADAMTKCVALCQEQRWREALLLCRQTCEKTVQNKGKPDDLCAGLMAAQGKIDRSLRRQIMAALVEQAAELLQKEYLLDVSE